MIGNTVHGNHKDGILIDGELNIVDGNEVFDNTLLTFGSRAGINLRSATNNTIGNNIIRNNLIRNNLHWVIELRNGNTFNLFKGNIVNDNAAGGIVFAGGALDHDNTFYDNLFSNSLNNGASASTGPNSWTNPAGQTSGINIIGGPFLGGNFYGNGDGTGFSQTCVDGGGDGICDSSLVFNADNVDGLPLRENIAPVVTPPADTTVEAKGPDGTPASTLAAFLAGATAFDTVDLALVVINDAPKIFPEGTTQVSFRATDLSGNTATAVSSVLVIEDGDEIHPFIDGRFVDGKFIDESMVFSNNFTGQHIAKSSTFGFIADRAGLAVTVEDLAVGGMLLSAEGAAAGVAAVSVCGTTIKLAAGKVADVACGSLILGVIVGPVELLNSTETTTVALSTGTTATVYETTDPTTGELTGDLTLELDETTVVTVPCGTVATVTEIAEREFLITNDTPQSRARTLLQSRLEAATMLK